MGTWTPSEKRKEGHAEMIEKLGTPDHLNIPPKEGEKKIGRPPAIDDAVVSKLEYAFALGCNDSEACLYADISRECFYNWLEKNPRFVDRKESLKQKPMLKARKNIVDSIHDGNLDISRWYAERKGKDEFSTKSNIGVSATIETSSPEEIKRVIAEALDGKEME